MFISLLLLIPLFLLALIGLGTVIFVIVFSFFRHKRGVRMSLADIEEKHAFIIELVLQGESLKTISKRVNMTPQGIYYVCKLYDIDYMSFKTKKKKNNYTTSNFSSDMLDDTDITVRPKYHTPINQTNKIWG